MDPAPSCKTAILSFIIDETLTKLWNVSSISRKRVQMIVGERHIIVEKYNMNALKINGWVKVGKKGKSLEGIDEIKKGVSSYNLWSQEEVEKVISLNGKLRCYRLEFQPEVPFEIDYIEEIIVNQGNFDYYLKCSFKKASDLTLESLFSSQINQIINKFKHINHLSIYYCSISSLDLSSRRINEITFLNVTFSEKVDLPSNLYYLEVSNSSNTYFLNPKRVKQIRYSQNYSLDLIKKCKGIKIANVDTQLSELMNHLSSTTRELGSHTKIDSKNIDLVILKKKFPFLIRIYNEIPIEIAQTLNLRIIETIINETKETFILRPRKIFVNDKNVEQLNKHPELFKKVEEIWIYSNQFNFDCLPIGIKRITLERFPIEGKKHESLEKNNWKLEKTNMIISCFGETQPRKILNSLTKVGKIEINRYLKHLMKEYPQFRFTLI